MKARYLVFFVMLGEVQARAQSQLAHASTDEAGKKKSQEKAKAEQRPREQMQENAGVLDFEGELIEGERKRPDLFLQIGTQKQTMESIVYGRKNFNDFHKNDKRQRPSYFGPKEGLK